MRVEADVSGMQRYVRGRVPAVTGLLTVVSLALVFGAVLGVVPGTVIPRAPAWFVAAIPHVNAGLSLAAIATITVGWRAIRRGRVGRHRAVMVASLALFGLFLGLYLYRVSLVGPAHFDGPAFVDRFVYLPLLTVHVLLAVVCLPLLYYVALLALTRPVSDLPATRHAQVGRVAASLWLVSFAMGVLVYLLLYAVY